MQEGLLIFFKILTVVHEQEMVLLLAQQNGKEIMPEAFSGKKTLGANEHNVIAYNETG